MGRKKNELRGREMPFAQRLRALMAGKDGNDATIQEVMENYGEASRLAKSIGVLDKNVGEYYMGYTFPETQTILKIAKHYGVSIDYLLGASEVRRKDLDLQMIGKHTGLWDSSIEALRLMSQGTENLLPDQYGMDFINRALTMMKQVMEEQELKAKAVTDTAEQLAAQGLKADTTKGKMATIFDEYYRMIMPLTPEERKAYQIEGIEEKGITPPVSYAEMMQYIASKKIDAFYNELKSTLEKNTEEKPKRKRSAKNTEEE